MTKRIITTIMVMVFALCTTAMANEFRPRPGQGFGQPPVDSTDTDVAQKEMRPRPPQGPFQMLVKFQQDNLAAEVLAAITGQTLESITETMQTQDMRELIKSSGIDRETFETAMDEKAAAFIAKAVENGSITQTQADSIIQMMAERPERPATDTTETQSTDL